MKKRWNVDRERDEAIKYWSSAPLEPKVKCQLCCDRPCQQAPVATSTSNWTQLPSNQRTLVTANNNPQVRAIATAQAR